MNSVEDFWAYWRRQMLQYNPERVTFSKLLMKKVKKIQDYQETIIFGEPWRLEESSEIFYSGLT